MSDDLNTLERILWFDDFEDEPTNQHRFLSNFYIGEPIRVSSTAVFPTGEHAFAAYKAADPRAFHAIATAVDRKGSPSPGAAKSMGRSCTLRPDWEVVKLDVMAAVIRAKFTLDRVEGHLLLETGNRLLMEGTYWHDRVWGVDLQANREDPVQAPGRNWLGTLLMARRAELVVEELHGIRVPTGDHNLAFFDLA